MMNAERPVSLWSRIFAAAILLFVASGMMAICAAASAQSHSQNSTATDGSAFSLTVANLLGATGPVTIDVFGGREYGPERSARVCVHGSAESACYVAKNVEVLPHAEAVPFDSAHSVIRLKAAHRNENRGPAVFALLRINATGKPAELFPLSDATPPAAFDLWRDEDVSKFPVVTASEAWGAGFTRLVAYEFCPEQDRYLPVDGFSLPDTGTAQAEISATTLKSRLPAHKKAMQQLCSPAMAGMTGVYSGDISGHRIAMEIGKAETPHIGDTTRRDNAKDPERDPGVYSMEGRYVYLKKGQPLMLLGRPLEDGSVLIREYVGLSPTGFEWRMTFKGDASEGTFCQCDASRPDPAVKPMPVVLKRISTGFDPKFEWKDDGKAPDQAYFDLLVDFPFSQGPPVRVSETMAYVMQSDSRFHVSMPKLTRFPDAAVMKKVNDALQSELEFNREWAAICTQANFAGGGSPEENLKVTLTASQLRIEREVSYRCGWERATIEGNTITFDMRTGKMKSDR